MGKSEGLRGRISALSTYHTDAYAIAVKNGFEGTEEEWLESLKGEPGNKGEPGPKGDPGVVKFVVVTELPQEDTENAIYLLPNEDSPEGNLFDEYIFVDGKWEKIGSAAVAVNLDEYVKKTDYASSEKHGVVKVAYTQNGLYTFGDGWLSVWGASANDIDAKNSHHKPIVTDMLDHAVKVGVTTNTETLTDEEKTAACGWLGTGVITANEDGTLTILLADGTKYKVNATVIPTLKGVWVFNESPDWSYTPSNEIVSFTSNGTAYVGMDCYINPLHYVTVFGSEETVYEAVSAHSGVEWENEAYRTVDFGETEQEVSADFYAWFTANAVAQG